MFSNSSIDKEQKNNSCKIPTLIHLKSLINSQNSYEVPTICKKTNSSFKHRYTIMIQYDMWSWHMKVISEIRKNLQKWRQEVVRNRKGRKSLYLKIRIWVQTSGTWHLGCFLGTWKEEYKIHGRKQRDGSGKTLRRTSRAILKTWMEPTG